MLMTSSSVNAYVHPSASSPVSARKLNYLKGRIFVLTFLAYAIYSAARQPFGITKSALNPDQTKDPGATGFAPFNDSEWGSTYLGACDTVFLSAYAIGLFITGPLGDRVNLRWFLGFGMIGSGAFCFLFGAAALFSMHSLAWFIGCNVFAGLFQATGWPATVTLMTRWFGQGNRGTIMGVWNAQSSVGNIIGKFWATFFLHRFGWGSVTATAAHITALGIDGCRD
jgi:OPA family glycerol-3-phosphate transporter-like MFS transporter 1/2